jgi:hypothetical protein
MATFEAVIPSGSVNGKQIKIVATATPGTLIHTAVNSLTQMDEVWIWVTNNHTSAVDLTIEWGGVASPDDQIKLSVPSKAGDYLVKAGVRINNNLAIRAFASVANVLCISANVNRITP